MDNSNAVEHLFRLMPLIQDPVKLETRLQCQLLEADHWFGMSGMITNPDKYQAMILGNTNYTYSFKANDTNIPVKDNIDL